MPLERKCWDGEGRESMPPPPPQNAASSAAPTSAAPQYEDEIMLPFFEHFLPCWSTLLHFLLTKLNQGPFGGVGRLQPDL